MSRTIPSLNTKKKEQIRIVFFTLKTLALLFTAIPLLQYLYIGYNVDDIYSSYSIYTISITFVIFGTVMFFLMFIFNKNEQSKFLQRLEIIIFIAVYILSICVSGANESNNKFIFLFIIIAYTIEYGMKTGLVISAVATVVIGAMDLMLGDNEVVNMQFENDLALFAMFFLVAWTIGYYAKLEKTHIEDLTHFANIDGLTGTYNHRYFHETIEHLYKESHEKKTPLSLLMIDIDYFKKYNDNFGHSQGDELLKQIAQILRENIRVEDILCRYGGDEFCVILPNTHKQEAIILADRLRKSVNDYYSEEDLNNGETTLSIGVSTYDKQVEKHEDLIENADMALYRAKFLRKNRVEVYSSIYEQINQQSNADIDLLEEIKSLKALITVINSRDTYTYKHVERVFSYCSIIADHLELEAEEKRWLLYAAYLHDLGKINISKETLISNKKLSQEEWEELKKHPQDSADILRQIKGFEKVVPIVAQHHEKYDGSGYPMGLKGEEINYLARILTVVDSFDAMTNHRPYQKTKSFEEAFEEIERCKGTQFDPIVADQFIEALKTYK